MKSIITAALLAFGVLGASAADNNWLTDMEKAKEIAKKENKAILLNFTGSDWCGFCIKLKDKVFTTKEFQEYASENLVLVEVDFPDKKKLPDDLKKANEKLKNQFGIQGYPTIVIVDASGNKLGEAVGYGGDTPKEYIAKLDSMVGKKRTS